MSGCVSQNPMPRRRPPAPPRFTPDFCRNDDMLSDTFLRNHLYNLVYIWLSSGHEFWLFPTELGENSMTGYAWDGEGWTRCTFDPRLIKAIY